jgi:hypothetical protein
VNDSLTITAVAVAAMAAVWRPMRRRIELSRAKHRSLTGHSRMAKRFAAQVPGYSYDESSFFDFYLNQLPSINTKGQLEYCIFKLSLSILITSPTISPHFTRMLDLNLVFS